MDRVGYGVGIWGWIDVLKKTKGWLKKHMDTLWSFLIVCQLEHI